MLSFLATKKNPAPAGEDEGRIMPAATYSTGLFLGFFGMREHPGRFRGGLRGGPPPLLRCEIFFLNEAKMALQNGCEEKGTYPPPYMKCTN